jgi:hypothetical protein
VPHDVLQHAVLLHQLETLGSLGNLFLSCMGTLSVCRLPLYLPSYEVDRLTCPKCQGQMRIIAFIQDEEVIKKIFKHLGL